MNDDDAARRIVDLVGRIDRDFAAATSVPTCTAALTLARALVAAQQLVPRMPTVDATLDAARAYLADPCEATYDRYVDAATASYPFGPGDGCHAVSATGVVGCAIGSGCRSGAGTLVSIAATAGYAPLAAVLDLELASVGGVE